VDVEWDPAKAATNLRKHGIDFLTAAAALDDPFGLTVTQERGGELRYLTLAQDAVGRVLVIVYTERQGRIRLVSARTASPQQRRAYQELP
jgi:uncharacterized DUF497 family protein